MRLFTVFDLVELLEGIFDIFLLIKSFQSSSSGLSSGSTDSPLGHLNDTSLYSVSVVHLLTAIKTLFFICAFILWLQKVDCPEMFIVVMYCISSNRGELVIIWCSGQ